MKRTDKKRMWQQYFRDRWRLFLIFAVCFIIFLTVFLLYRLEKEAFCYACLLCGVFLGALFLADVVSFVKKHRKLQSLREEIGFTLENLPHETKVEGKDYQELLFLLMEEKNRQSFVYETERKEMEDYFTLWAHQMKLPIAAMKLVLETDRKPDVKVLKSELFKIEQYAQNVLVFFRMKSPYTDYVFREVFVDDLIRQAVRRFSGEFIRKKIRLDFQETEQKIFTDEKWVVFVLEQILSNAIKYSGEKGEIRIYAQDEGEIVVQDNGVGIDEADLERIFEKGFTGLNGRMEKQASGLGLYLCKNILKNLSCDIKIESKKGKGTKVHLFLGQRKIGGGKADFLQK